VDEEAAAGVEELESPEPPFESDFESDLDSELESDLESDFPLSPLSPEPVLPASVPDFFA
jgi:hypothetical protein